MSNCHPQVVLVTGASSGIGQAVAQHLHAQGYRVFGTQYQTRIIESTITMIPMNVDDDESVRQGMVRLYEEAGRLDAVVNSAGWSLIGSIEDTSLAEAKAQLETNFFGVLRVSKAALPFLRGQGSGHIVNINISDILRDSLQAARSVIRSSQSRCAMSLERCARTKKCVYNFCGMCSPK